MEPPTSPRSDISEGASHAPGAGVTEGAAVHYRAITGEDLAPSLRLVAELGGITLGGFSGRSLERAYCRDALRGQTCRMIVAERDGVLLGYTLAVIDPARSLPRFLRRHPWIASRLILRKIAASVRRPTPASEPEPPSASPSSWNRPGADRARIVFIGVSPRARGLGVGAGLYDALFDDLAARGVTEILARIATDNHGSLRLHQRTGWRVQDLGDVLEASRVLPLSRQPPRS